MNEFEFISEYLSGLAGPEALDLKDDAAIWTPPDGLDVVISTDTLVEGIHFPSGKFDADVARKLLAVNLSDITAKGADPVGYLMNLTVNPTVSADRLSDFCDGLRTFYTEYEIPLWGGDTTKSQGPIVLSVTLLATVPTGQAVLRSGANPGDVICLSGPIGDAFLGLKVEQKQLGEGFSESVSAYLLKTYHVPEPPFKLRHAVRKYASAALDVSDGLVADAGHLAQASNVLLKIDLDEIPISESASIWLRQQENQLASRISLATGGDDYQVLMCVPPENFDELMTAANKLDHVINKIGIISSGEGVDVLDVNVDKVDIDNPGYTHF